MLDELLGRAALKDRIAELEADLEDCQDRLGAEERRRKDAVSEKQDADRRVNRLEDRIADLEGNLERLREEGEETRSYARTEALRGERRTAVLDRLESFEAPGEGAFTAYVANGHDLPASVREAFDEGTALVQRAAPTLALTDDAGLVTACLSVPDPPAEFAAWDDTFAIDRRRFEPTGEFTLALVRSDLFAMGVYEAAEQVAFQGFDSDLQQRHSKGGFSQARFERLRDEQIDNHLERCRVALEDPTTERLYVVGEHTVLESFADSATATATVDATGDPADALDRAFRDFWTVRLRVL